MDTNFSFSPQSWSTTVEASANGKRTFFPLPLEIAILVSTMDGAAVLVGATANLFVMAMIAKHRRMLQNMDLLIFSLCLSDFICSIFIQPLIIMQLLAQEKSSKTETVLRTMALFTFQYAGCSSLFLVTLDKYVCIRYPFHYSLYVDKSKVYVCIGCVWLLAWLIGIWSSFNVDDAFRIYVVCTSVVIGLTVTLQILAFRIARTHQVRIRQLRQSVSHNHQESEISSEKRTTNQAQMNATKTIILLFVIYVGTWFPVTLFRIYYSVKQDHKTFFSYINILNFSLQLHACINPFIYVLRTRRMKTKFLRFRENLLRSVRFVASSSVGSPQ